MTKDIILMAMAIVCMASITAYAGKDSSSTTVTASKAACMKKCPNGTATHFGTGKQYKCYCPSAAQVKAANKRTIKEDFQAQIDAMYSTKDN